MAITDSLIKTAQAKADEVFVDGIQKRDYIAKVEAINTVLGYTPQNATLDRVVERASDGVARHHDLDLIWIDTCGITSTDTCTDACLPATTVVDTAKKTYTIGDCSVETQFLLDEATLIGSSSQNGNAFVVEDFLAKMFLKADKELSERLQSQLMTDLNTFRGENKYVGETAAGAAFFTYVGSTTKHSTVAAANWSLPEMMAQLELAKYDNKFSAYYMIHGQSLELQKNRFNYYGLNGEGKGDAARMNATMPMVWVPQVASDEYFVINPGSLAFVSWNAFTPEGNGETGGGNIPMRFSMPSQNLPGISWDVTYFKICSGKNTKHSFKIQGIGKLFQNPLGCDQNVTGVFKVKKV